AGSRLAGALALQHLHDGSRVQPANLAQVARFFQQAHVVVGVKTIAALGAVGAGQSQGFPSADRRRRNPDGTRYVTDFEINFGVARHDFRMCLTGRAAGMHFSARQRPAESLAVRDYSKGCVALKLNRGNLPPEIWRICSMPSSKASRMSCWLIFLASALSLCLICSTLLCAQGTGGRILGRVADPSGAVLAGVRVTATNEATGANREVQTNGAGDYVLVEIQPGTYTVQYELTGFKKNVQKGIIVDVNQVVTLNTALQIGGSQEIVEVSSEIPQVDTTSTQLGAVINERSVNELPLNTRDTYQFLQLQPGVQAQLGSSNGALFFGSDDAGAVSVNGGRTRANNFSVNGGDANDLFVNLPTIQPTPDSIAEFRVITNTFDAEYGRNSGSVVNVITKSGTNTLHGNIYEYFRNTILDAQGFLNTTRPQLNQNQFGGTLGGAIAKDRTFFFVSYEGRRIREGQQGPLVNVPTTGQRSGDFSQIFDPTGSTNAFTGSITDQFVADVLNGRTGCTNAITSPVGSGGVGGQMPAAGLSWSQVFPTSVIPSACQDPVAVNLQRFIPGANPNLPGSQFQNVPVGTNNANQFTLRFDHRINDRQNFTAYYYFNDGMQLTPFNNFEAAGANIPGFGNYNDSRDQQYNLTHAWTLSSALVNEARFVYMREGQLGFLKNVSTGPVTSSCTGAA